tara:strand:+ start:226 stop:1512 length:1287 start_codon:yes stop_codon:yes gene_type:complete
MSINLLQILNIKYNQEKIKSYNWIYEFNKNTSEFIGINDSIYDLKKWLLSSDTKQGLIIHGPIGSGKSSSCIMSCIEEKKLFYIRDATNKRSKKDIISYYDKIKSFVDCVLIMDDMDIMANGEIIPMHEISKWLKKNNNTIKIIFIINDVYLKKMKDIMKLCDKINYTYPSFDDYLKYISNKKYKYPKQKIKNIVYFFNFEPRSILNSIKNNIKTEFLQKIDRDYDMYDSYHKLFSPISLSDKFIIFQKECGTLPIILQENYIDMKISNVSHAYISNQMALGDIFHKHSFSMNNNITNDVYGVFSFLSTVCYLNNHEKKAHALVCKSKPRFGLLWTKQSAMYQKKKFINNIQNNCKSHPCIDIEILYDFKNDIKSAIDKNKDVFNVLSNPKYMLYDLDVNSILNVSNLFSFDVDDDIKKKIKHISKKS